MYPNVRICYLLMEMEIHTLREHFVPRTYEFNFESKQDSESCRGESVRGVKTSYEAAY